MKTTPLVSVVMSVYNAEQTVAAAIQSILDQTFTDFEFIIIDDGSTDKTAKIIASYKDPRIKVISQTNHGLIYSLNLGIKQSKGTYIARMDADDLSELQRLSQQIVYLKADPTADVVGTAFAMTDDSDKTIEVFARPTRDIDIKRQLFAQNPLGHGSVMMRRQAIMDVGGYTTGVGPVEDYDLWIRLFKSGVSFAVVPEALYRWRNNLDGVSSQNTDLQQKSFNKVQADLWASSQPPVLTIRQMLTGLAWYRSQTGKYSQQITREYVRDQHRLAKQYLVHHMLAPALKQWLGFMLMSPYNMQIAVGYVKRKCISSLKHIKHLLRQWTGIHKVAS